VNKPPAIFLMGPTAAGKTDVAVELVKRLPCQIISVDSALIYRDMDIGTAKPDSTILAQAPHYLLNIRDPAESYSAAEFRADALGLMAEISASGQIPLLVGGTGLYFRALQSGLAELPPADEQIRAELEVAAQRHGWAALHQRLVEVDPISAARIHPNDPQRIQRALEVYMLTREALSALLARQQTAPLPYTIHKIVLAPHSRDILRERISQRFYQMLEQGLLEEVNALYRRGDLNLSMPSMRAVGYRQVWLYLTGELGKAEMTEAAITATRQLAKRQLTWLRREQDAIWVDSEQTSRYEAVLKNLSSLSRREKA
jgi:tRNA dimethylallyltransferase